MFPFFLLLPINNKYLISVKKEGTTTKNIHYATIFDLIVDYRPH